MLRRAPGVEFAKHQIDLQRTCVGGHARNRGQGFQQLIWVVPMCGAAAPVANNLGIRLLSEDFLPYLEISRNVWIAVRPPPNAGQQKQQTCVAPKHARSGTRKVYSAEHLIKMPQPGMFGERRLWGGRYTRQVEKTRPKPAAVLREQFRDELFRRIRTRLDQFFPGG